MVIPHSSVLVATMVTAVLLLVEAKFHEKVSIHSIPDGLVGVHFEFHQYLEITDTLDLSR